MNIGTIIQWGSNTIPDNWLLCDGSAVSRTTYADLFAVIGTNFGTGDGSTTFNLPDLRGRVGVGKSSDTEFDTLGETGGSKNLQSHSHFTIYNEGASGLLSNNKTLAVYATSSTSDLPYALRGTNANANVGETSTAGTGNSGNLQPYIVTNYIIKALVEDKVKISELESATSIDGTEVMPIVQSGTTKKITTDDLLSDVYSTNEVKTNKIWIDGKPIYRRVFTGKVPGSSNIIFQLSNCYIIDFWGKVKTIYNNWWIIPTYYSTPGYMLAPRINNARTDLVIEHGDYYDSNSDYEITIEYTKTTD